MAEKDSIFQKGVSEGTGDIAIALDSIMRWIGKSEDRFTTLASTNIQNQRSLSHIVSLIESRGDILRRQMVETDRLATRAINAVTKIAENVTHLQIGANSQSAEEREKIERTDKMIASLEERLAKIEQRIKMNRTDRLAKLVSALAQHLDAHSRWAARNATSSKRYFDLMTEQIETFSEELNQLRDQKDESRREAPPAPAVKAPPAPETKPPVPAPEIKPVPVPEIKAVPVPEIKAVPVPKTAEETTGATNTVAEKTEPAARKPVPPVVLLKKNGSEVTPDLKILSSKLDSTVDRLNMEAEAVRTVREETQANMNSLRQRIQVLEQLGHSFRLDQNPVSAGQRPEAIANACQIRSSFIAAARQATRNGQVANDRNAPGEQERASVNGTTPRFLRVANLAKN